MKDNESKLNKDSPERLAAEIHHFAENLDTYGYWDAYDIDEAEQAIKDDAHAIEYGGGRLDRILTFLNSISRDFSDDPDMTEEVMRAQSLLFRLTPYIEQHRPPQESNNLYLLYSCNEWCEKSKAPLILVTSDKETLCAAIGGEILTGNMEYLGESGGKGFAAYKKDYLAGNDVMKELNYGFVKEMDESLLSAPDTLPEYYTAASEFLAADFHFDPAEFDKAYSSEDAPRDDDEEEYEDEI